MRLRLRRTDIMGRLGGDEFVVLLPHTEENQAEAAIRDLLDELADAATEQGWPITYSVGVVSVDIPCESGAALLIEVDRLMYEVKKSGKNSMLHRSLRQLAGGL